MRAFETEKTDVAEVDRSIYDIKDGENAAFEVNSGLTRDIVEKISEEKHDLQRDTWRISALWLLCRGYTSCGSMTARTLPLEKRCGGRRRRA